MKRRRLLARGRGWSDALRTRLWPVPVLFVLAAVVLGVLGPRLDRRLETSRGGNAAALHLFGGGADAARTVLSAIAGSLVTATSLTFSLTVVTLQLASSQYSPRLLRTFTRDGVVQVTLGLFLATFTYSLAVLRVIRSENVGATTVDDGFVPRLSVTVAVALTLASVLALVALLAHLVREIRVETVLARVHAEAEDVLRRVFAPLGDRQSDEPAAPAPDGASVPLRAPGSGFLTRVDVGALVDAARGCGAVAVLDARVGDFVVRGSVVGRVHGAAADAVRMDQMLAALTIEVERTAIQDPAFALRQIVDVAVRALSPGVNDPTTAVHALGWTSALLVEAAGRSCGVQTACDDEGIGRAFVAMPSFADLVELGLEQPLRYGVTDPQVALRLATLIAEVADAVTGAGQRITLRAWIYRFTDALDASNLPEQVLHRIRLTREHALDVLDAPRPTP